MKWIKIDGESYYPAFRCSECNAIIYVVDECLELPCYCKNCESQAEPTYCKDKKNHLCHCEDCHEECKGG